MDTQFGQTFLILNSNERNKEANKWQVKLYMDLCFSAYINLC